MSHWEEARVWEYWSQFTRCSECIKKALNDSHTISHSKSFQMWLRWIKEFWACVSISNSDIEGQGQSRVSKAMERAGYLLEFSHEKFPGLEKDDFLPWRHRFSCARFAFHVLDLFALKDVGQLKLWTWVKLIWSKWDHIIFSIITSKGNWRSKKINYLNIELACLLGRERIWK